MSIDFADGFIGFAVDDDGWNQLNLKIRSSLPSGKDTASLEDRG